MNIDHAKELLNNLASVQDVAKTKIQQIDTKHHSVSLICEAKITVSSRKEADELTNRFTAAIKGVLQQYIDQNTKALQHEINQK